LRSHGRDELMAVEALAAQATKSWPDWMARESVLTDWKNTLPPTAVPSVASAAS
jgi:hypothetical protein